MAAARAQATLYFDVNGQTGGSGVVAGATYAWGGTYWASHVNGANGGNPATAWIAGSNAVFAAGNDAIGAYTVTITSSITTGTVTIEEGAPTFVVAAGATWTVAPGAASTHGRAIAGAGGLAKSGAAALTLAGANSYAGLTAIDAGVLAFSSAAALSSASAIRLGGGSLQLGAGGAYATAGALSLSASGTIDFGTAAGARTLSLGASAGAAWQAGATLTIVNYNAAAGDRLRVGASAAGLTPAQLSQITFNGFAPGATIDSSGYLAPVPEPAPVAALLGAAALACAAWRRRMLS